VSFASPIFLWGFMPVVLAAYLIIPAHHRNAVLAVSSLAFYAYGAHAAVFLLLGCIGVNYAAGIAIEQAESEFRRNAYLAAVVVADVGVLGYWKYAGFFTRQARTLAHLFGGHGVSVIDVALPIGISFFTFHLLSYVIDVWRERSPALRHPLTFVTYIAMFPQLIAGPIVRYHEIADQLTEVRTHRAADVAAGFPRFILGLSKKVVVADSVGPLADALFSQTSGGLTTVSAWIGVLAFSVQIYFDFSGYTDMAIGLARMFGFRFPENFARPYSAHSITDFWRRWHMSLSRWFRDYVYIPLGGNRGSAAQTYRNLIIVFVLTGLWHGAAWTFLLWGLYHGGLLIWERRNPRLREVDIEAEGFHPGGWSVVFMRARTFLLVMVGWVLFRSPDLSQAGRIYRALVLPSGFGIDARMASVLTHERAVTLALALTVLLLPRRFSLGRIMDHGTGPRIGALRLGYVLVAAPVCAILVAAGTFSPFLYYQF